MLLASAALAAVLLAGSLAALTTRSLLAASAALVTAEAAEHRASVWAREQAVFRTSRARIANGVQAGTGAVQLGSNITRTSHRMIASIPFWILRAIPATRPGSERVRVVHDGTAEVVYDAIDTVGERIAEAVRRRMLGAPGEAERDVEA